MGQGKVGQGKVSGCTQRVELHGLSPRKALVGTGVGRTNVTYPLHPSTPSVLAAGSMDGTPLGSQLV